MAPSDILAAVAKISPPPPAGSPYALPVPGSEKPNRTPIYRHWRYRDLPLLETLDPTIRTLHDSFEHAVTHRSSRNFLGWRPWNAETKTWEPRYDWMTYAEAAEHRKNLGAGIVELHKQVGVTADKYGVGIWCQNRPEWQLTELALISQSLWNVSLYETLGPNATEYIINHGKLVCIFSSLPHIPLLLKLAPRIPSVKLIICVDPLDAGEPDGYSKAALLRSMAQECGIQIFSFAEVEEMGARSGRQLRPPGKEDITTINYTSGTTGDPKGVVLTHANMVAAISTAQTSGYITPNDTHISYLPLAHIYGRMADWAALSMGARIGYFHGDITALVEDMQILRPTGLFSVPRLFNRFHSAIMANTLKAEGMRGALSRAAMSAKMARMKLPPGQATNYHPLYDRIWSPKVRKAVGLDRAKLMVTGSAQLGTDVQQFLRAAFGITFVQGYGMTETCAVGAVQLEDDFTAGNIGAPQVSVEFCIESVPDLEYTVEDKPHPRGELLLRGPIVFGEYYRNEAETSRSFDSAESGLNNGPGASSYRWFHTGDIVEVDALGRFKIIDRKKNVLKLAQGEYVSPENIENVYIGAVPLIASAFVHGDGIQSCMVGVLGLEPEVFAPFASKLLGETIAMTNTEALRRAARDPRVKAAVQKQIDAAGKKHKLNSFERIKNVYVDIDPFTVENDLLTPTLKLKRPQAVKAFRTQIDEMYAEINANEQTRAKI